MNETATQKPEQHATKDKAPKKQRKIRNNEQIGGGWIVISRNKSTGRLTYRKNTLPFEHPTMAAAVAEAERLSAMENHLTFHVFGQVPQSNL